MEIKELKPRKSLNKSFLKIKPSRSVIELFKSNLIQLLDRINDTESEEFHKNLVSDFLKKTYYDPNHFINTKGRNDLVIHNGNNSSSTVGVIIEAKKPTNKSEMISRDKINVKSFQELILYYLRERNTHKNLEIKHLVITNINEWYIFDSNLFEKLFQNKTLINKFNDFQSGRLSGKTTDFFYKEVAEPFISELTQDIEYTYFDLRDYQNPLRNGDKKDDGVLISLFKLLSPEHLLKLPFENDSNSLDKRFYSELLHIMGLTEIKSSGKKLIERVKSGERNQGSLIENTIIQLESLDKISRISKPNQYGDNHEERLFNVALELNITWINRILFLKLLEAQLLSYHKGDKSYTFLNLEKIKDYDDLNSLFFQVLARKFDDRNIGVKELFKFVPYLNSSLFEPTELEHTTLFISNLIDDQSIPIFSSSVLKDLSGKKVTGDLSTIHYLFEFLNSYDFSSEGNDEIQEENKTLINASVLGLIFEKINGYKDGSYFTPGFVTMYMSRNTIRKTIVQKFNEIKKWNCNSIDDLYEKIDSSDRSESNEIINSIKICDPAVGSGHFLVSALNEIISVKNDLKILQDSNGKWLKEYQIEVVNDELIVTDEEGQLFQYNPKSKESQRVQETLFREKQTIIENCLFGVDINVNSVKICRLRLWIELLKNSYYKNEFELETLPNIDINIKCGNSLISRFPIDSDLREYLKKSKWSIEDYKKSVYTYKNAINKEQKREMEILISDIKSDFKSEISYNDPIIKKYKKINGEIFQLTNQTELFQRGKKEQLEFDKQLESLKKESKKLEEILETIKNNKVFENSFEWRLEFPEVLNSEGEFVGFDCLTGNPPYLKEYMGKEIFDGLREKEVYQGKMDIWYLFGQLGIEILKENGILNYIAPNNWTTNSGSSKFRNYLLKNTRFLELVDFGSYMVFDSASIQTMIMSFVKDKTTDNYEFELRQITSNNPKLVDAFKLIEGVETTDIQIFTPTIQRKQLFDKLLTFNNSNNDDLISKIQSKNVTYLTEKEVAQGIVFPQDFLNKKSVENLQSNGLEYKVGTGVFGLSKSEYQNLNLSDEEKLIVKPYFTSSQFDRYSSNINNELFVIYTDSSFKDPKSMDRFPNLKSHLDSFKDIITSDNKPYGLHRSRDEKFFKGEKIVVQRKCPNRPVFSFTEFDSYISATFNIIKSDRFDLKFLTGLLNSKLIEFWLKYKGKMQGNNFQIDKEPLVQIPILNIVSKEDQLYISSLVDKIIEEKRKSNLTDISELESKIDEKIYQLYELNEQDILTIEDGHQINE